MRVFAFIIFFFFNYIKSLDYIRQELNPKNLLRFIFENNNYLFSLNFRKFPNNNIHILVKSEDSSYEKTKIKYAYIEEDCEPMNISIPINLLDINIINETNVFGGISYYFDIEKKNEYKQVILLVHDTVNSNSFIANTIFDQSSINLLSYENENIINLNGKPFLSAIKTSGSSSYHLNLFSNNNFIQSSEIYCFGSSREFSNDFLFHDLSNIKNYHKINLNEKDNFYINLNSYENIKTIYFICNSTSIGSFSMKISQKPYLINYNLENVLNLQISSQITLFNSKLNDSSFHYIYFKHEKNIIIDKIYYYISEKEKETDYYIKEFQCINKQNKDKSESYYYCDIQNFKINNTFSLILYTQNEGNFSIKKRNFNQNKYQIISMDNPKILSSSSENESQLIYFQNTKQNEIIYLILSHNIQIPLSYKFYLSNQDINDIFDIPDEEIESKELIKLSLDKNEIIYLSVNVSNINSDLITLISLLNFKDTINIEQTSENEEKGEKKQIEKYKEGNGKFENKIFYLLLDIEQFKIGDKIYMKFKVDSQLSSNIYYSLSENKLEQYNLSYKTSTCDNEKNNGNINYYCTYEKMSENDNSIKFILYGKKGDSIYFQNTESYEYINKDENENNSSWLTIFIIIVCIIGVIIVFLYIRHKKKLKAFSLEPLTAF